MRVGESVFQYWASKIFSQRFHVLCICLCSLNFDAWVNIRKSVMYLGSSIPCQHKPKRQSVHSKKSSLSMKSEVFLEWTDYVQCYKLQGWQLFSWCASGQAESCAGLMIDGGLEGLLYHIHQQYTPQYTKNNCYHKISILLVFCHLIYSSCLYYSSLWTHEVDQLASWDVRKSLQPVRMKPFFIAHNLTRPV